MTLSEKQQNRLNKLKELVTLRVDEYSEQAQTPFPEVPTGDIEYELNEAAKSLTRKLDRVSSFVASRKQKNIIPVQKENSTVLPLADDFLRFVSVKLKGWRQPATDFVRDTSAIYRHQIYDNRRAGVEKPVAAMIPMLDEFDRYYEQNKAKITSANAAVAARRTYTFSGWTYNQSHVTFTIDGVVLRVGGFSGSGTFSGGQTAQTLSKMLNGDFVDGAAGYDTLPHGYIASFSSNVLTIERTKTGYDPIEISFSSGFTSQITITSSTNNNGFGQVPIVGDKVMYATNEVGEIVGVDGDVAILKLDEVFLDIGYSLTVTSGQYQLGVTELKTKKFKGETEAKRALEVFPKGEEVEHLIYVPYLKAHEFPTEYEDALVWSAVSNVLLIMRQGDLAGNAMEKASMALTEINAGVYGEGG